MTTRTVDLEEINLTDFDSTSGTGLNAIAPGLVASVGCMKVVITDISDRYGEVVWGADQSTIRSFFALDINKLTMADDDQFSVLLVVDSSNNAVFRVELGYNEAAGGYRMRPGVRDDGGSWHNGGWIYVSDNEHFFEVEWHRASGAGQNDGSIALWRDTYGDRLDDPFEAADSASSGVDNDTRYMRKARLGAPDGLDSGTSGTILVDHLVVNDTGAEIGHPGILAFPTAEGAGRFSRGGRGGTVYKVTNTNDSGAGSLRAALTASGPRIVVFETDGVIELDSNITIENPYISILGQTAPGDGVCTKDYKVRIRTHDVIIRYVRFRKGDAEIPIGPNDQSLTFGNTPISETDSGAMVFNVIVDHCSLSWSADGVLIAYSSETSYNVMRNFSVQWCILSEPLYDDVAEDHAKSLHIGSGSKYGARNVSIHHCLFIHAKTRNPRVSYTREAEILNNVMHNITAKAFDCQVGSDCNLNFEGNTATEAGTSHMLLVEVALSGQPLSAYEAHQIYVNDNDGNYYVDDPWQVVGRGWGASKPADGEFRTAWESSSRIHIANSQLVAQSRTAGRSDVLQKAGCFPRDSRDEQMVTDVQEQNTPALLTSTPAYPTLSSGTPGTDTDGDGMPDTFEDANPPLDKNTDDSADYDLHSEWTNIECYSFYLLGESYEEDGGGDGEPEPAAAGFRQWLGGLLRFAARELVYGPVRIKVPRARPSLIVTDFNGVSRRLEKALRRRWSSHYGPDGSGFGYLMFSLPRKIGYDYRDIGFGYRVRLVKYLDTVLFDGQIRQVAENQAEPDQIDLTGLGWNVLAGDDAFNYILCDTRYVMWKGSEMPTGSFCPDKFDFDLQERVQFKPRTGTDFAENDYTRLRYTFPFGEVAERIKFDYDVALPDAWPGKIEVRDSNDVVLWSKTATESGTSVNLTTTDSPTYFEIRFYVTSAGENTAEDGTVYARLTNLKVYGVDDATVDGGVVARKVLSEILSQSYHGLSASTARIGSPGLALEPSAFDTDMSPEQVLSWLCKFGDEDGDPLAWGVGMDTLRRLFLETMDLTTIRYVVRRESALQAQVSGDLQESYQTVYGVYTDTIGDIHRTADRSDQDAIDALGGTVRRRALSVDGATDETQALVAVDLYLAENPRPRVSSSFTVQGNIFTPAQVPLAFDEVRAGGMVRVRDFRAKEATLTLGDFRDQWTTFLLVGVEVDEDAHSVRLIPAGDVSGFERYMALLAQLRGGI